MTTPNDVELIRQWWALDRDEDVTGVSGTGRVGYVLDLPGFGVLLVWDTAWATIGFYPDRQALIEIHGNGGTTRVTRLDPDDDGDGEAIARARDLLFKVGHRAYTTLAVATTRLP